MGKLTTFWLKQYLKQGRLVVVYALVLILAAINAFIYSGRHSQDLAAYQRLEREYSESFEQASQSPDAMAGTWFNIPLPPRDLKFMVDSKIETVPTTVRLSPERISLPTSTDGTGQNFLGFDAVDLTFIVEMILTFIALVLTYDAICGEKQQGTLKLLLASQVPRWQIFISKLLAAVITLAIPLLFGLIVNLATIQALGTIQNVAEHCITYGFFFLFAILLLLLFAAVGVTFSSLTRSPITSLVLLVLVWVLIVLILPGSAKLTGKALIPVRSPEEYERLYEDINDRYFVEAFEAGAMTRPPAMAKPDDFKGEKVYNRFSERQLLEYENLAREQLKGLYAQAETIGLMSKISPSNIFRQAIARLADNDLKTLQGFFEQGDRYNSALFRAMREADENDNDSPHLLYMANAGTGGYLSTRPFGADPPKFTWNEDPVFNRAIQAVPDVLILAALSALVVLFGVFALNRYDVR